jgi:phosphoribosylamine--glycine ligase
MLRLEDDLLPALASAAAGRFEVHRLHFRKEAAACLVLASQGYPAKPVKGEAITGLESAAALDGVEIFHAGTTIRDAQIVSNGGRVINVCASGPSLREALTRAYLAAAKVRWPSKVLRHDIGRRVLERTTTA